VDCCETTRRKERDGGKRKRERMEGNRKLEGRIWKRNGERVCPMENAKGKRKLEGKGDWRMEGRGSD